ncbi:MAG: hypothetical protein COY75_10520, partial [Nitrospirae bacterium CG_4_10_14_0_8_um_filter_41_23]
DKIAIPVKVVKIAKRIEREVGREEEWIKIKREREGAKKEAEIKEFEITPTPIIIDAGFIIGTIDAVDSAFKILGIKSSFAVSTD